MEFGISCLSSSSDLKAESRPEWYMMARLISQVILVSFSMYAGVLVCDLVIGWSNLERKKSLKFFTLSIKCFHVFSV